MGKYIFSTLTASQKYPLWARTPGRDIPHMVSYVLIHGGANLPSKVLVTPRGVMTPVSDEQYKCLTRCSGFQNHLKNGYLKVEDQPFNPDIVAENMKSKDSSAPMVPEDFEESGTTPPSLATSDESEPDLSAVNPTQRSAQAATKTAEEKAAAEKQIAEEKAAASAPRRRRGGASSADV